MKKGMSNVVAAILVVLGIVAVVGGMIWIAVAKNASKVDYSKYDVNTVITANEDNGNIGDHIKGNPDAPVKIFEYADYQCSACATVLVQLLTHV